MDHLLTRLVDVNVRSADHSLPCASAAKSVSTVPGHPSANNAADTSLPYNPWYGSHTEHQLQAMSLNDADHPQVIRPVTVAAAKPLVHVDKELNNDEGLDQETTSENIQAINERRSPAAKYPLSKSEQSSFAVPREWRDNNADWKVSFNDLVEAMLNLQPLHRDKRNDRNEDDAARTAADVEETSRTGPDKVAVPFDDMFVATFMAGTKPPLEDTDSRPQQVNKQSANPATERNAKQQAVEREDVTENQQHLDDKQVEKNVDDEPKLYSPSGKESTNNQATEDESLPVRVVNGKSNDVPQEPRQTPKSEEPELEEPPCREKTTKTETESKPETTVAVSAACTSSKANASGTLLTSDNGESKQTTSGEKADETCALGAGKEISVHRTESVTGLGGEEEELMEVDEESGGKHEDVEQNAAVGKKKCEGGSDDKLTSGAAYRLSDKTEAKCQQKLMTQSERGVESTTTRECRPTVSADTSSSPEQITKDDCTSANVTGPVQCPDSSNANLSFSGQDVEEFPGHTSTHPDNPPPSRHDESSDADKPAKTELAVPQRDPVTQDPSAPPSEDDDTSQPCGRFPKSSTGHRESDQEDLRAKRLTKTVRVYNDLSTCIDYEENGEQAVTTIHLKSTRKR